MYGTKPHAACCNRQRSNGVPPLAGAKADPRRIALLAIGRIAPRLRVQGSR